MIGDIVFATVFVLSLILLIYNYVRGKRLIASAQKAQYPPEGKPATNTMTAIGEMEPLSLQMKMWKKKRLTIGLIFVIFTVLAGLSIVYESFPWMTSFLFLIIAINTLTFNKIPCFLIMNEGIYLDERFFKWEKLKYFSIHPVKIGSLGYGMFENSSVYTEIKIRPGNGIHDAKYIFFLDKNEVEKVRQLLVENGVPEAESSNGVVNNESEEGGETKKQQTMP